jgi:hypothetical protein
MEVTTIIFLIYCVAIIIFTIIYVMALYIASKSIFHGSGSPIEMAHTLLQSIMTAGQIIVGVAILATITMLIFSAKITSEVGLPIIATLAGYLVGKNFNNKIFR